MNELLFPVVLMSFVVVMLSMCSPVSLAYAAPVAAETVGFGSFPVEPIILDDDSCCFLRTTRSHSND